MIKNLYLRLLITASLVFISCSNDVSITGKWTLSDQSIQNITNHNTEQKHKSEINQKAINKIKETIIFNFLPNGDFFLEMTSQVDSAKYSRKGNWDISDNKIKIKSDEIYEYDFKITGSEITLVNPSDSLDSYILKKILN